MLILTPNRRLAAFSQRQFQQQQAAAKLYSWPTAEIYPLEAWILQLWQGYLDYNPQSFRPIVSKTQQQQLVERIIQHSAVAVELLRVNATAQNVIQAWNFLQQWQVDFERVAHYAADSPDTTAFYTWINEYLTWLDQHQYYDFNLMLTHLTQHLTAVKHMLPTQVCLRGFSEITPQYANFFAGLRNCGIEFSNDQLIAPGAKVARSSFLSIETELTAAATWAMAHLQDNPQQVIGIVVPELEQQRQLVESIFEAKIPKAWLNISAPYPLANYPLIGTALLILQLAKPIINFNDLSLLLRSLYIAGNMQDAHLRAQLDRRLRETCEAKITWQTVLSKISLTETSFTAHAQHFQNLLKDLQGHTAEHWAAVMQQLLLAWGWPGERVLTTSDADMLSCWRDLLDEYCKLNVLFAKHSFAQAVQMIQRLANDTPFLPAETGLTKIHILGILEADGIAFDQLWVSGMTRDTWPMEASPNPFIPMELQRQFELPRSSPQRELAVAKRLTANFQQGAKQQIIFSYPRMANDHALAPSNLIAHLPAIEINLATNSNNVLPVTLQKLEDSNSPALETNYISGGTSSLKLQAQCPFKANAELRLQAKPLAAPQLLLTMAQRGSIVHEVLEKFWQQCTGLTQLLELLQQDIQPLLLQVITKVLLRWQKHLPQTLTKSYLALETDRLLDLIYRWLLYEAKRVPFTVHQIEQKTAVQIGPLQINMKIDRVDQIAPNSFVIIDYKTGQTYPGEWFGEPIIDPQLPLYAVCSQEISAVAIASLQAKQLKFMGVAAQEALLPNVTAISEWDAQKQKWQASLQATAQQFVNGHASVTPHNQKVCNLCQLQALCRVYD